MKSKRKLAICIGVGVLCLCVVLAAVVLLPKLQQQSQKNVEKILKTLSTEEKIGQVLLMSFSKWGMDADGEPLDLQESNQVVEQIIQDYHLGNLILFGANTQDTEKTVRLVNDLQNAAVSGGGMPMLIGIDQEGGSVTRLGQGTCLPGNMALGASGNIKNAQIAAGIIGTELAALGIHCTFAPVSDVNDNPQNPVINLRAFSADPQLVADMSVAFGQELAQKQIISAAKHFPGHGNTMVDTHVGLAVVDKSKAEWEAMELVPFQKMIANGIDIIMSAHIQYPQLDSTQYISKLTGAQIYLPATLSKKILTDILRTELGFDGVVVTDAMDMGAIIDNFGEAEASVMALAAGADLICNPTKVNGADEVGKLEKIYAEIKLALTDGRLTMERLNEAAQRVLLLKQKYGILETDPNATPVDQRVKNAQKVVGSTEHRVAERALADAGITYQGRQPYTPMQPAAGDTVLFLVPYENKGYSARYAMDRLLQEQKLPEVKVQTYVYGQENKVSPQVVQQIADADHVVLVSQLSANSLNKPEDADAKMPQLFVQAIIEQEKTKDSAVISIGLPNDANSFPDFPLYVAYGYQGMEEQDAKTGVITKKYGPNLPAAIDCLMGAFSPSGILPVDIAS